MIVIVVVVTITSGQSDLTKRPHRCCTWMVQHGYSPGWASVHPANTWFFGPTQVTRVHTPNGISVGSAVFAGLPDIDGSVVFASLHQCAPHVTHASLGQPESTTKMASRSVQRFFHRSWRSVVGHIGATWRIRLSLCTLAPSGKYDWTCVSFGPSKSTNEMVNQSI